MCHITCEQLRLWSREVREDFLFKNRRMIPESIEPTAQIKIERLENTVAELKSDVVLLSRQLQNQNQLLHRMLDCLVNPHVPLNHHHSQRKRKIGEIADISAEIEEPDLIDMESSAPVGKSISDASLAVLDPTASNNVPTLQKPPSLSCERSPNITETSGKFILNTSIFSWITF